MALRSPLTIQPYDYIGDPTGRPLDYGRIYIGAEGLDPEFNQIPVYLDAEMTKPIDQPIRTNDGFVGFSGDFTELYASAEIYSVKILDKDGRKVIYKPDMTRKNLMSDALADLDQSIIDAQAAAQIAIDETVNTANSEITSTASTATQAIDEATTISNQAAADADAAIQELFEGGGLPAKPFATQTLMNNSALPDGSYAVVTDSTDAVNGLYLKTAGAWVKSKYDPSSFAKSISNGFLLSRTQDVNVDTAAKTVTFTGLMVRNKTTYLISNLSLSYDAADTGLKTLVFNPTDNTITSVLGSAYAGTKDERFIFGSYFVLNGVPNINGIGQYYVNGALYEKPNYTDNTMVVSDVSAIHFNFAESKIVLDRTIMFVHKGNRVLITPRTITLPTSRDKSVRGYLVYNTLNFSVTSVLGDTNLKIQPHEVVLCAYKEDTLSVYGLDEYTVNGVASTEFKRRNGAYHLALFDDGALNIDFNNDKVELVSAMWIPLAAGRIIIPAQNVALEVGRNPLASTRSLLLVDLTNSLLVVKQAVTAFVIPPNHIMIGAFHERDKKLWGLDRAKINGELPVSSGVGSGTETSSASQYINTSTNLFNADTATIGSVIRDTGIIESAADTYAVSDYIAVSSGSKYTISGGDVGKDAFINTAYYDKDKVFIARIDTLNRTTRALTITVPTNAAFIRFNITGGLPTKFSRMFNNGEVALTYEPYYNELTGISLGGDILQQISEEVVVSNEDRFIFDTPLDGTFNTEQIWTQYTDFDSRNSAAVYAMYDTLAAQHTDYITKQSLGNDSVGNQIAAYKFKPARATAIIPKRSPIIYLVCGTHGGENVPPLAVYLMMEQICNNWRSDKLLEALRFNVDFIIIPVSNPSGRNSGSRKNANGVDINRSFPEGFGWQTTDPASPYYGGEEPLQELESQYISQIFNENPNIDICYDFHNFGGVDRDYYIWIPTNAGEKVQHMGQVLMQKLGRKWQAEFSWLPQRTDWFAGFVGDTAGAMVQDHAKAKGVKFTGTFEIARDWQLTTTLTRYDQTHCKTMVEAITNWLLINLKNL